MKKATILCFFLTLSTALGAAAAEDHDRPVSVEERPAAAREFIELHFPEARVALAKMERDFPDVSYEVIFTIGAKLEFDGEGRWTKVSCKYSPMPDGIVPEALEAKAQELYPGAGVIEIERGRREVELKLVNGMELTFSPDGRLLDIDD